MGKYLKSLENLNNKFGSEWIKPAVEAVIDVALQDYFAGTLTASEYDKVCQAGFKHLYPKKAE